MNKTLAFVAMLFLAACAGGHMQALESAVIARAEDDPAHAPDYFMYRIEHGATYEEQALYMYGSGLAHERQGDKAEAGNDYLSAAIMGYPHASAALRRIKGGK